MKEFMLYIRNGKDAKSSLSTDEHHEFIKKCEVYITFLKNKNKLIAAQPLLMEGVFITKPDNKWVVDDIETESENLVGYYHILAEDIDEAIKIAIENPEFEYVQSASIEVRQIKTKESETGFIYPTGQ